jgi:cell division GTPase FtsZ
VELSGAKEMLINFVGNITVAELKEIESIKKLTGRDASLKYGVVSEDSLGDEIEVVILISGIKSGAATYNADPEPAVPEKVEIATQLLGLGVKQIVDSNYENVDIPTYQRSQIN